MGERPTDGHRTARKVWLATIFVASALFSAAPAAAQHRPEDYHATLRAACGREINNQCKGVPDRSGKLLACLYDHEVKLLTRCDEILVGSLERLGKALFAFESKQAAQQANLRGVNFGRR